MERGDWLGVRQEVAVGWAVGKGAGWGGKNTPGRARPEAGPALQEFPRAVALVP